MILTFLNPLNNKQEELNIDTSIDTLNDWYIETRCYCENSNVLMIRTYLDALDCNKYVGKLPGILPGWFGYIHYTNLLFFHLNRINNQILYNKYVDRFIAQHCANIIFSVDWSSSNSVRTTTDRKTKKQKPKNVYVRYESKDLFSDTPVYNYVNHYTGDDITSNNPNLLEELNRPKVKEKKVKHSVSMNNITFNFKKK